MLVKVKNPQVSLELTIFHLEVCKRHKQHFEDCACVLVESMRDIIPCTSQLDPCVPVSVYTAPDVLSFRFCSCVCNRDNSHELLQDYFSSSWRDFRRCDAGVPVPHR